MLDCRRFLPQPHTVVSLGAIKALNSELKADKAAQAAQIAAQAAQIAEFRATVATQARTDAEMKQQFANLSAALEKLQADRVAGRFLRAPHTDLQKQFNSQMLISLRASRTAYVQKLMRAAQRACFTRAS
jgi:uncharacterized phage infection (PIP) family protein YhgE